MLLTLQKLASQSYHHHAKIQSVTSQPISVTTILIYNIPLLICVSL
jgi:hypothetical protein